MRSNVTAILVAKHSGETLSETIAAIRSQTVQPDRIIVVAAGPTALAEELGRAGFDRVISTGARTPFGQAVAIGAQAAPLSTNGLPGWLWLLAEDTAPEPDALQRMLTTVQSTGTAAVAGPKLVDWFDPSLILELGQGLTSTGSRWVIDRRELDQQQYDHTEDVLGVGPVGMLVRRDVWANLGGFDPALPVVDDGLDFSVRARLAGYRVIVVPEARIRTKRSGIAGPEVRRSRTVLRRTARQARAAHLHRRVAYAPAPAAPLLWLAMPIIGLLGMIWSLIRERPGTMLGELWAAFSVFFRPGRILRSRKRIRAHNTVGWQAVRPLRVDRKTVKTTRMVRRETILTALGRQRRDLNFTASGGLAVIIVSMLIAALTTWWAFGASTLTGGGFAPLSDSPAELWAHTMAGGDAFTWVLAVLGSLTFWNPPLALVLLVNLTVPLAALGGWLWGTRVSETTSARVLIGLLWAVSPVALGAIAQGRPAALIVAATLPWLLHALANATRSWSWVGVASLLAAVVLACAPVLWPAAIVLLIVGAIAQPRASARIIAVMIAPVTLVLPRAIERYESGGIVDLLADPGIPVVSEPATQWQMLLGFPTFGLDGWGTILASFGIADTLPVTLTVGFLLIPLGVLVLLGLYTGHPRFTALAALAGALGLLTALLSPKLLLVPVGDTLVSVWAGSGLALYWIAVVTLAGLGVQMLFRAAPAAAALAIIGAVLVVSPGLVNLVTGQGAITPDRSQVPAVVVAESNVDPATRTLVISTLSDHELRAHTVAGKGARLDAVSIADPAAPTDRAIADLVGSLASTGASALDNVLDEARVQFIVLSEGEANRLRSSLQAVFDQHPELTPVGDTQHGLLWRVNTTAEPAPVTADEATDRTVWIIQIVVLLALLALALPTGEARELPEKRPRTGRRAAAAAAPVGASGAFGVGDTTEPELELFTREAFDPIDDDTFYVGQIDDDEEER